MRLETDRLVLRPFDDADRAPFAGMNADPVVMHDMPSTLSREQSDAFVDRVEAHRAEHGWALWAVEVRASARFVGYVGPWPLKPHLPIAPGVEVGWRLAADAWGRGYATEAALAAIDDGHARVGLTGIMSFTAVVNARSRAVMERIGLRHVPAEDFEHPDLPVGHRLRPHVVYRRPGSRSSQSPIV